MPGSCKPVWAGVVPGRGIPMRLLRSTVVVPAPLRHDEERVRWYSEAAERCVVLTRRGRLLEPSPVFGPTRYRVLAVKVDLSEARRFTSSRAFRHEG